LTSIPEGLDFAASDRCCSPRAATSPALADSALSLPCFLTSIAAIFG
jgi:hypothetical protein